MMRYDPLKPVDPDEWLALGEDERLHAIEAWLSEGSGRDPDDFIADAAPIMAVEHQVIIGDPPITRETLDRLLADGLDRMRAVFAIAGVLSDQIKAILVEEREYDAARVERALRKLDAAALRAAGDPRAAVRGSALPRFEERHRRVLVEFGQRYAGRQAWGFAETAGFMLAVAACPEMVKPPEWLAVVRGRAKFADDDEAEAVTEAQYALMKWVDGCIGSGDTPIPESCRPPSEPMQILEQENEFSGWCRGVTAGHQWLQEGWDTYIDEDSDDDLALGAALTIFSFFSSREMAEFIVEESDAEEMQSLEDTARLFHPEIEHAARQYAAIGLECRKAFWPQVPNTPARSAKVGRNEPCPCGSGKKYKKCCGRPGVSR